MSRLDPADRKEQIMAAAVQVAAAPGGWSRLTRSAVAGCAGCADALVSRYYGTMTNFRRAVMRQAIKGENLSVIAQGLAAGDKTARKAPEPLKAKAVKTLTGA